MYHKKRKEKKLKIIIICGLIVFFIIGFIINVLVTNRNLTIFEKAIKDSILTIENFLSIPIDYIHNKVTETNDKNNMYKSYSTLKEQIKEYEKYKIENEELKKQLDDMKELLNIDETIAEYSYLNANVISRNIDYWNDTVIINKGEHDGIESGMPVVVGMNLVGKVISTSTFNSTVRLLTATNIVDKISVKINNNGNYIYGILNGYNIETGTYIIEGISQNVDIENDSIVTTTGMGDIYPSGIVIGNVTGITTDTFDLSKILEVKSNVDFDNINYLTVLRRNV